ncbi:BTAD domain-containing putative transcriptional regulator [Actinomadura harenae]|uniref:BTAD domain-containing putative transcriptional regulator n=1 Tax=Actinomadura harenae TaxID=2483351 RepID=UPI001F19F7F9|nr:BTAD domain-containing putative transcriptional regulator [Actinomadura harenae]
MILNFGVLGPLRVEADGAPVPMPRAPVLRALLGVLLAAEGQRVPLARLVELVWAGQGDRVGRGAVHTGVSRLRDWLGRFGDDGVAVDFDEDGYRLVVAPSAVDLGRFRALASRGDLAGALALRRGPVLAGLARLERSDPLLTTIDDRVRSAALALADRALDAGTPATGIGVVTAMAEDFPLDEPLQAARMRLLAADGRPAQALRCFHALRRRLADELGVEPGGAVQQAFLAILAHDGAPEGEGDAGAGSPVTPAELPADVPDFAGRREHLASVKRVLRQGGLPVIVGMGGIGKTTLAVHAGYQIAAEFPDGQLYVDLRGAEAQPVDPGQVLARFLRALGVAACRIPETTEERSALYRSVLAGRRVLVVLDNAADQRQVRPLLPGTAARGASGPAAVITSRSAATGLPGAVLVEVDVLDPGAAVHLLGSIAGHDRTAAERQAASDIVRLCGYIPLAVRIAGARLARRPRWALARLAGLLGDERRRLTELSDDDLAVHASFALSYARLRAETRRVFRLLGLLECADFASWTAAAVAGIGVDDAQRHLEALIDAQLLTEVGTEPRPRYRVHDLVRLYARERSVAEDDADARLAAVERALGGWLWLAERAADQIPGRCHASIHGPARRWPLPSPLAARLLDDPMAWFDAEQPALSAAVRQAARLHLAQAAWDLAACQEKYCDLRGLYDEWRGTHRHALLACKADGDRLGEAVLQRGVIEVTIWATPDQGAQTMVALYDRAQRLLELFESLNERRGMADALVTIAWSQVAQGRTRQALDTGEQALRLATESGHLGGQARAHQILAIAHHDAHTRARRDVGARARRAVDPDPDLDRVIDHMTQAWDLARLLGNARFEATAMQFLGAGLCKAGQVERGHDLLTRSLDVARALGDHFTQAFSLIHLARLYTALGDERARPTAEAALAISLRNDMGHHHAETLQILGELDLAEGRPSAAVARLEEATRLWRARGWRAFLGETLHALGRAYAAAGDEVAAARSRQEADHLLQEVAAALPLTAVQANIDACERTEEEVVSDL